MIIEVKNFSELKSHLTNSKQYNLSVVSVSTRCVPIKENKRLDYWFDWTLEDVENNNIYKFNLDSYSKDFADFIENANVKIDNKEILCYLLYLGYKITNKNFSDFDVMIAKSKYFGVFNYVTDKYTLEPLYNKRLKMLRAKLPFTFRDKTDLDNKASDFIKNVLYKEMEFTEGTSNKTYLRNFITTNTDSINTKFCKAILDTMNTLDNYKALDYLDYLKYFGCNCGNRYLENILRSHNIEVNESKYYLMSLDLNINDTNNLKDVITHIIKTIAKDLSEIKDSSIVLFYNSSNKLIFKINNNVHPTDAYKLITNSIYKELPLLIDNCRITTKLNECFKPANKKLDMNFFNKLKSKYPNKLQNIVSNIKDESLN